jgi:hypothetical protein
MPGLIKEAPPQAVFGKAEHRVFVIEVVTITITNRKTNR